MGNLMIGVKRFLTNKNTVTIFAILLSLGILYWAYSYRIQKATEPVNVPYATRDIGPRTEITSEMVSVRKVPGGIVTNNVLTSTNQIVGKYVLNTAVIPSGSLFYKEMVVDWEELPSSLFEDIPDDNTVVLLGVDLASTFGNSIYPGNYIDLYYYKQGVSNSNLGNGSKLMLGKFIESIRVLAVVDSLEQNVFETIGSPNSPAYLMFSVPEDIHLLLKKAERSEGYLFPVQRNAEYSKNPKETRIVNNYIKDEIEKGNYSKEELYGVIIQGGGSF